MFNFQHTTLCLMSCFLLEYVVCVGVLLPCALLSCHCVCCEHVCFHCHVLFSLLSRSFVFQLCGLKSGQMHTFLCHFSNFCFVNIDLFENLLNVLHLGFAT